MSGTASAKEAIGFIGIGLMGHGMAKNIADKGWPLTFLGRANRPPAEDLIKRGATEVATPKDVAARSTVIFLCVTGSPQVEEIVRGANGLIESLQPGTVIVDCSTADPNSTLALARLVAEKGGYFVDAPLSRTPKEAWEGTLDTMVGADPEIFARIQPVLAAWAGKIVHIGAVGDGHKMKLINNFISLGYGALYAEAVTLAAKVGISPERFDSVIRGGRMDCGFYQTFMKWTLDHDRNAHKFTISNAHKDLRYLESMSDAAGLVNPMGNAVKNTFAMAAAAGGDTHFVPQIVSHVSRQNGFDLGLPQPGPEQGTE
jgi:3-hydroxyisobutyrate dehydrogenase-like beta-hydroxyacid dehydrogenase